MKSYNKSAIGAAVLLIVIALLSGLCYAQDEAIKYTNMQFDIFGVRFDAPDGWKSEVTADFVRLTPPDKRNIQLLIMEDDFYPGNLEEYFVAYNRKLKEEKVEATDKRALEVAGGGAIYVRANTDKKDVGHVIFMHEKKPYIIALKTEKANYRKYEPILLKMAETLKFYKPFVKGK
jgi:predicted Zn-dependent protease